MDERGYATKQDYARAISWTNVALMEGFVTGSNARVFSASAGVQAEVQEDETLRSPANGTPSHAPAQARRASRSSSASHVTDTEESYPSLCCRRQASREPHGERRLRP